VGIESEGKSFSELNSEKVAIFSNFWEKKDRGREITTKDRGTRLTRGGSLQNGGIRELRKKIARTASRRRAKIRA